MNTLIEQVIRYILLGRRIVPAHLPKNYKQNYNFSEGVFLHPNKRKLKMKILNILLLVSTIFFSTDTTLHTVGNDTLFTHNEIKNLTMFMDDLGHRESTNRYYIVSEKGYLGKYQFHMNTLKHIGIQTTKQEFLNNPALQDSALVLLLQHNKQTLHRHITNHSGKVVNDVEITESGILAAAHLVGAGSVNRYFNRGVDKRDGNGVRLTDYLTKFSGYELEI